MDNYINKLEEENKALQTRNQELENKVNELEVFKRMTLNHEGTWEVTAEDIKDDGTIMIDYKFEMFKMENYEDKKT